MDIRERVRLLVREYRLSVGITAADIADTNKRIDICYAHDIDDAELTEQYCELFALEGIEQQSYWRDYGPKEYQADWPVIAEVKRRIKLINHS